MLRRMVQHFGLQIAVATLIVLAIGTGVACLLLGWTLGLIIGAVAFVLFDGLGSVWEVATYRPRRRIADALDRHDRRSFGEQTRDNPTIR